MKWARGVRKLNRHVASQKNLWGFATVWLCTHQQKQSLDTLCLDWLYRSTRYRFGMCRLSVALFRSYRCHSVCSCLWCSLPISWGKRSLVRRSGSQAPEILNNPEAMLLIPRNCNYFNESKRWRLAFCSCPFSSTCLITLAKS